LTAEQQILRNEGGAVMASHSPTQSDQEIAKMIISAVLAAAAAYGFGKKSNA
jgi:hypothetical protein